MNQIVIRTLALALALILAHPAVAEVTATLFWQQGCPYCERAKQALAEIEAEAPDFRLIQVELGISDENNALFRDTVQALKMDRAAVPLFVIGATPVLGFAGERTAQQYRDLIDACRTNGCTATLGAPPPSASETVSLPVVGEIALRDLSLPLLTVVLAAVDGFNPCAMWVLALLIGMLLGVQDARRMWTLGAVFLLATGVMYFAVMTAWLNVLLWIGAVGWLRIAIGAVALGAGAYYLREYLTNPEGVCRITPSTRRKTIGDAFRNMVEQPSLLVATLGVAGLAVAVNLIELVCSAGIPAIYTQTLAMHDIPAAAHYGYLALYLGVFLLDDTAIFVAAMVTLRAVAATGRYSRMSHLVGGVVLLALGAVMILRPDLLG